MLSPWLLLESARQQKPPHWPSGPYGTVFCPNTPSSPNRQPRTGRFSARPNPAPVGQSSDCLLTPDPGYHVGTVSGCGTGTFDSETNTYTTGVISADCQISATFAINRYAVTIPSVTDGAIVPSGPTVLVDHGSTLSLTITASTGRHITSVSGCGGTPVANTVNSFNSTTYITGPITAPCSDLAVTFAINRYSVTGAAASHGSLDEATPSPVTLDHGAVVQFRFNADPNYHVTSVSDTCGGEGYTNTSNSVVSYTYSTPSVTTDCAVSATFGINLYAVTFAAGPNGTLSGSTIQTIPHGSSSTQVTATADTGYHFVNWTGDNGFATTTDNPLTVSNVTSTHAISAHFAANPHTLTVNTAGAGSGEVGGGGTYDFGSVHPVTATSNPGSTFTGWSGDCSGSLSPQSVTMFDRDMTCTATFVIDGSLSVTPAEGPWISEGIQGGPFSPASRQFTMANTGGTSISWTVSKEESWLTLSLSSGILAPGASVSITVSVNDGANALSMGDYGDTLSFMNATNSNGNTTRPLTLSVLSNVSHIEGLVTDPEGSGIRNVRVDVFDDSGNLVSSVFTDAEGNYATMDLPSGDYRVKFNGCPAGYQMEWYADKNNFGAADPVSLTAPDATTGIDAILPAYVMTFTDVPPKFEGFVGQLVCNGITAGYSQAVYAPGGNITRAEMAVFIERALDVAAVPSCSGTLFGDVTAAPLGDAFCRYIEDFANRGITAGCGNGDFCPESSVTRTQMAVFIERALDVAAVPPCSGTLFGDVTAQRLGETLCGYIEDFAGRGMTAGCGNGAFCPNAYVTRGEMAVFITKAFLELELPPQ